MIEYPKKFIALILIVLILIPLVERGIHGYEHKGDYYCRATSHHLHTAQPKCLICEFISTITYIPFEIPIDFRVIELYSISYPDIRNIHVQKTEYFITLRAPPLPAG